MTSVENDEMFEHLSNQNEGRNFLTRQRVAFDDHWTQKSQFNKSDNQGEATLLDIEPDETPAVNSNQEQIVSRSRDQQLDSLNIFSPNELNTSTIPQPSLLPQTRTNAISSPIHASTLPINVQTRRSSSKIPVQSKSSSQSRSGRPPQTKNTRQIPSPATNKGAFNFFKPEDHQAAKTRASPSSHPTSFVEDDRKGIARSDDEEGETHHLKGNDLKLKIKEEKRHGKKTGELLNKLHENYEELLQKYAQAENTIDQLRFQPKIFGDNTPKSHTSEHLIHMTHQSKINIGTLRSSGAYRSTTGSPFSSIRPVPSTTTTTPARKSVSPANSGTIDSVYFDEVGPKKIFVQELTTPETWKLDLLIETKGLGEKMKSFLTLMDANQLSLAEQKQVYETMKQDYEKLIQVFDHNKSDLDVDLHQELESMKQLLNDIVKKITQNLLGKSVIDSSSERQTRDESQSSQLSLRSSLCNHNDLMNQYQRLLTAANTTQRPVVNQSQTNSKPINNKPKAYVYVSGDSDDEQQQSNGIAPIPYTKGIASTSFDLDYIPSTSVKHHQHKIEEKTRKQRAEQKIPNDSSSLNPTNRTRYSTTRMNDYDSGIGTNNLTKLSYDSKLYARTMNESHFQSLDDEQESISSSSHSSRIGSASLRSPYSQKFDNRATYQRKPSNQNLLSRTDSYPSDTETHLTGSFDISPQSSSYKKNMHRSHHTWKSQKPSVSRHSRPTPSYRSTSIEDYKTKYYRPLTTISSKINTDQGLHHQRKVSPSYRSSVYINETHTHKGSKEKVDRNLYLDPQTGIVYRSESNKTVNPPRIYYEPSPQTKLYQCGECGSVTTYHHRHHINSPLRRVTTNSDDLGYESGYKKRHRRYRYIDSSSSSSSFSSGSDSDVSPSYRDILALNQAYNQAEKVQYRSRCLSRYIIRQLKHALATS